MIDIEPLRGERQHLPARRPRNAGKGLKAACPVFIKRPTAATASYAL